MNKSYMLIATYILLGFLFVKMCEFNTIAVVVFSLMTFTFILKEVNSLRKRSE